MQVDDGAQSTQVRACWTDPVVEGLQRRRIDDQRQEAPARSGCARWSTTRVADELRAALDLDHPHWLVAFDDVAHGDPNRRSVRTAYRFGGRDAATIRCCSLGCELPQPASELRVIILRPRSGVTRRGRRRGNGTRARRARRQCDRARQCQYEPEPLHAASMSVVRAASL
jgi:hypothetical protein